MHSVTKGSWTTAGETCRGGRKALIQQIVIKFNQQLGIA